MKIPYLKRSRAVSLEVIEKTIETQKANTVRAKKWEISITLFLSSNSNIVHV